jgi:hypothetical protein
MPPKSLRTLLAIGFLSTLACATNRPRGVPWLADWQYVEYLSEPAGAKIEVNDNYIGNTPTRGVIWYRGSATLTIKAYPNGDGQRLQTKIIQVPPIPQKIYFDMTLAEPPPIAPYVTPLAEPAAPSRAAPSYSPPLPRTRARTYYVEKAIKDETFIINGEIFKAKTYCFGILDGDEVMFTEGSPYGACASAEFVVLRTGRVCKCWCE